MANFGHRIRWLRSFGRLRPFSEVFSEGQVKVRSKRSNFQIYNCGQTRYQSSPVSAQESNGVICFCVRPPEVTKIAFERDYVIIGYAFGDKNTPFGGQRIELLT